MSDAVDEELKPVGEPLCGVGSHDRSQGRRELGGFSVGSGFPVVALGGKLLLGPLFDGVAKHLVMWRPDNSNMVDHVTTLESVDLFAPSGLRLDPDGPLAVESPPRLSDEADDWMVVCFHVASTQDVHGDHWEIHPAGQEVVAVLSGQAQVILRAEGRAEEERVTIRAGMACIVSQNRWHRLEIEGPTDLQSITRRRGTRLEPRT